MYRIGFGVADISPTEGLYGKTGLLGYGNENVRLVTGVDENAPMKAMCLAVTDEDGKTVLLYATDTAAFGDEEGMRIAKRLEADYGVPQGCVMISANHQHATPCYINGYEDLFVDRMVQAGAAALADRKAVADVSVQPKRSADPHCSAVQIAADEKALLLIRLCRRRFDLCIAGRDLLYGCVRLPDPEKRFAAYGASHYSGDGAGRRQLPSQPAADGLGHRRLSDPHLQLRGFGPAAGLHRGLYVPAGRSALCDPGCATVDHDAGIWLYRALHFKLSV